MSNDYDAISKHELNIPHLSWQVRTPLRQFATGVLVDDDTLDSIFVYAYCRLSRGIGINAGRIRGIKERSEAEKFSINYVVQPSGNLTTVRCCTQNGIRGGSATVHFPIWHQEIEDIIVLKNNKGTEDNRVRNLTFRSRFQNFSTSVSSRMEIFHYSPHDYQVCMMLLVLTVLTIYISLMNEMSLFQERMVGAQKLILDILKERAETCH